MVKRVSEGPQSKVSPLVDHFDAASSAGGSAEGSGGAVADPIPELFVFDAEEEEVEKLLRRRWCRRRVSAAGGKNVELRSSGDAPATKPPFPP